MIRLATSCAPGSLPRSFRLIHLELAREAQHPSGDGRYGYTIVVPLGPDDRIDPGLWKQYRDACRVVRFRPGEDSEIGHLVHRPGGTWALHYDLEGGGEDETGFRFQYDRFSVGEYVSIQEPNGLHTFRVTAVEHV